MYWALPMATTLQWGRTEPVYSSAAIFSHKRLKLQSRCICKCCILNCPEADRYTVIPWFSNVICSGSPSNFQKRLKTKAQLLKFYISMMNTVWNRIRRKWCLLISPIFFRSMGRICSWLLVEFRKQRPAARTRLQNLPNPGQAAKGWAVAEAVPFSRVGKEARPTLGVRGAPCRRSMKLICRHLWTTLLDPLGNGYDSTFGCMGASVPMSLQGPTRLIKEGTGKIQFPGMNLISATLCRCHTKNRPR